MRWKITKSAKHGFAFKFTAKTSSCGHLVQTGFTGDEIWNISKGFICYLIEQIFGSKMYQLKVKKNRLFVFS